MGCIVVIVLVLLNINHLIKFYVVSAEFHLLVLYSFASSISHHQMTALERPENTRSIILS